MLGDVPGAAPPDEAVAVREEGDGAEHCCCDTERMGIALDDSCDVGAEVEEEDYGR